MGIFGMILQPTSSKDTPTGRGFDLLGGVQIQSAQSGQSAIPENTSYIDITISPVVFENAFVLVYGGGTVGSIPKNIIAAGELINSTTVRVKRVASEWDALTFSWQVIEFKNIKSIQRGTTSLYGASANTKIDAVNRNKAFLVFSRMHNHSDANRPSELLGWLSQNDNIYFARYHSDAGTLSIFWYVVEFN